MVRFILAAALPLAIASLGQSQGNALLARQGGDSFKPGVDGLTDSCAPQDLCGGGDNSAVVCLVRSLGDTCCAENYGCPGGSFCLTKGFCCPNGDDPATCAAANGITLPPGFKAGQTLAPSSFASSKTPAATSTLSGHSHSSSALVTASVSSASKSAIVAVSPTSAPTPVYTVPSNGSNVSPTGGVAPSSTLVPFTGEGNVIQVGWLGLGVGLLASYTALAVLV